MLIVHSNPWHIGVWRVQSFSLLSHLNKVLDSFLAGRALTYRRPVKVVGLGALLAADVPVVGVGLETDDEGQRLGIEVVFLNGASLNQVALTFGRPMLASERPAGSILDSPGIAIGIEVEVADLPEILSMVNKNTLVEAATFKDLSIYCWQ
jgi:hypothetical protein